MCARLRGRAERESGDLTKIGQFGIASSRSTRTPGPRACTAAPSTSGSSPTSGHPPWIRWTVTPRDPVRLSVDHDTVPAATAVQEIAAALDRIEPGPCCSCGHYPAAGSWAGSPKHGLTDTGSPTRGSPTPGSPTRSSSPDAARRPSIPARAAAPSRSPGAGREGPGRGLARLGRPLDDLGHAASGSSSPSGDHHSANPGCSPDGFPAGRVFPTEKETFLGF